MQSNETQFKTLAHIRYGYNRMPGTFVSYLSQKCPPGGNFYIHFEKKKMFGIRAVCKHTYTQTQMHV